MSTGEKCSGSSMMEDTISTNKFPDTAPNYCRRWSNVYYRRSGKRCKISTIQLPEELVYDIFLRLPVKSLIRFRCISKGVCGMIDSPSFVKKRNHQCERSLSSDYAIIIAKKGQLSSLNFSDDMKRASLIKLDCSSFNGTDTTRCCNGIFCFRETEPVRYVLWNPSNGTSINVGCPNQPPATTVTGSFGYDYVNDDYKIARTNFRRHSIAKTLQVYSLRKDEWRSFNGEYPPGYSSSPFTRHGICVSSAMHWLWKNPDDSTSFIAVFDFATESFRSLPLPPEEHRGLRMKPTDLSDFGGRLCVTFRSKDNVDMPSVWVMENYGDERSWTPIYIGKLNSPRIVLPFYYFPDKKEKRLLCNNDGLSWLDPHDHSFERIKIEWYQNGNWYFGKFIYLRNLVRLDKMITRLAHSPEKF